MNTYTHALLTKVASSGISPQEFVQAALFSGDPALIKVAFEISMGTEKVAFLGKATGFAKRHLGKIDAPTDAMRSAGKVNKPEQGISAGDWVKRQWRATKNVGSNKDQLAHLQNISKGNPSARRQGEINDLTDRINRGVRNRRIIGATAVAAPTAAYAMGDADTTGNRMARTSNRMFGTNFSTKSRLANTLGL